jgi:hypothetical protein
MDCRALSRSREESVKEMLARASLATRRAFERWCSSMRAARSRTRSL